LPNIRLDDIIVLANCGYDFEGFGNVGDTPGPWEVFNLGSDFGWLYAAVGGMVGATNNNFGSPDGNAAHDWLVSPPFAVVDDATFINFMYYERFGDAGVPPPLTVLITNDYSGDVETSVWTDVTPDGLDGSTSDAWIEVKTATLPIQGNSVVVAFVYQASTVGGGGTKRIGVDHICIDKIQGPLTAAFMYSRVGGVITARSTISGGTLPYTYNWNNGDDVVSDEANPVFIYTEPGTFMLTAGVTDGAGVQVMETLSIEITSLKVPEQTSDVRIATFNAAFSNVVSGSGNLSERMKTTDYVRFQLIADVIQRANPDVLFLNEFDHVWTAAGEFDEAMTLQSVEDFKTNYLEVAQTSGNVPAIYDHVFVAPCNTGIPSGYDFNNDGVVDDCCDDAFGFGEFPGQYAMVFLSKYPIVEDNIRTFQKFLWKDMPDSFLPPDPSDTDGNGDLENYYNVTEQQVYRLSSKSHWDIPVDVNGNIIHCLMSHPTPPVFDDGTATKYPSDTVADWNGLRNHDEIRFWADYVNPEINEYFYDDAEWQAAGNMTPAKRMGGLMRGGECDRFVILGDQNADPVDGDATFNPILLLLDSAMVDAETTPISQGALEQVPSTMTDTATKTANFNLRADYALPSIVGFELEKSFVFWPENADLESDLLASSDHRLVAVDVNLIDLAASCSGTMPTAAPVTMAPVESPMDDASGSNRFVGIGFIPTLIMAVTFVFASM
jgi:PKD repeat protein